MIFAEIDFVEIISRRVRNKDFALSVARRKREVVKDFQNEKAFRRFRRLNDKILVQPMNRGDRVVSAPLALFIFKLIIAKSDGSSQEKQS